jgi:YidC/Oxa1 family membrane protein insertase
MYAVIRAPQVIPEPLTGTVQAYQIHNNHLPVDSELFRNVVSHQGTNFLLMNLQCSAAQAGNQVVLKDTAGNPIQAGKDLKIGEQVVGESQASLDCGTGIPVKIPYFVMLVFMIATTFYQQRQMTKASPAGAQSAQQQAILKFMPLMFGIFGFTFPAGLVVYWTTSNLWQIGQQAALLRAGHIGPDALERRRQEIANKPAKSGGMFSGMIARAEEERKRRSASSGTPPTSSRGSQKGAPQRGSGSKPSGAKGGSGSKGGDRPQGSKGGRPSGAKGTPPQRPRPKKPGGGTTDGS